MPRAPTWRDELAARALAQLLAHGQPSGSDNCRVILARRAYAIADAMLEARKEPTTS